MLSIGIPPDSIKHEKTTLRTYDTLVEISKSGPKNAEFISNYVSYRFQQHFLLRACKG